MAQKKQRNQKGIRGGLQAAVLFLIAFIVLRYGIFASMFLGAIGGISVGFILRWWQSEEGSKEKFNPFSKLRFTPRKRYPALDDIGSRQSQRGNLYKKKPPEAEAPEED